MDIGTPFRFCQLLRQAQLISEEASLTTECDGLHFILDRFSHLPPSLVLEAATSGWECTLQAFVPITGDARLPSVVVNCAQLHAVARTLEPTAATTLVPGDSPLLFSLEQSVPYRRQIAVRAADKPPHRFPLAGAKCSHSIDLPSSIFRSAIASSKALGTGQLTLTLCADAIDPTYHRIEISTGTAAVGDHFEVVLCRAQGVFRPTKNPHPFQPGPRVFSRALRTDLFAKNTEVALAGNTVILVLALDHDTLCNAVTLVRTISGCWMAVTMMCLDPDDISKAPPVVL